MVEKKFDNRGGYYEDPFFLDQPPCGFVEELKAPVHKEAPLNFGSRKAVEEGEVNASGIYIKEKFPDTEGLLDTVYEDFESFRKACEIEGKGFPIIIEKGITPCFEAYRIAVDRDSCRIVSADTEGVRRAIFYLEGEMTKREGAFLPLGTVERRPYIKSRITRGFFSPTNRPPKNGDELSDGVDYYPEEYLNRLQHNGTNGLWIYTSFKQLLKSPYIKEYGEGCEARVAKLQRVIDKCRRYGVKVYVFAIEPIGFYEQEGLHEKYPEMLGSTVIGRQYPICLRTEVAREYIIDAVERLFRTLPKLAGFIDITDGERFTTCSSGHNWHTCPRCKDYTRGENLAYNIDVIKEGIRRAGTGAEFVSWTYGHRSWQTSDIIEYVKNAPDDVALMQNFDDAGYEEQLGKTRQAIDYWLSYVGPSQLFEITAKTAKECGKKLWAKMQVCCSHELATVPYIPSPGHIFDKFKGARDYGVEGVMECWYFGNYPSVMSRASGEFAFLEDYSHKEEAIFDLASRIWGSTHARAICKAFEYFEKAYTNYPINIMFSYYGPMHDGVVWELALKPINKPLPRTWLLMDAPVGDRIGECLWRGHTLDEAIELSRRISENWSKGVALLPLDEGNELVTLSRALGLLFSSGYNILNFYKLRSMLGRGDGDPLAILDRMEEIVRAEIENSSKMIPLCLADKRLGYHSEAEGFKFFPKKLKHRIAQLENLLKTQFPEVRERVEKGLLPLEYYLGEGGYQMKKGSIDGAERVTLSNGSSFAMSYDGDCIYLSMRGRKDALFKFGFEYELFIPDTNMNLKNGELFVEYDAKSHQEVFGDKIDEICSAYHVTSNLEGDSVDYLVTIDRRKVGWTRELAMKLRLEIDGALWKDEEHPIYTLGKYPSSPDQYGFVIP
ncbi:MAG: hypothetical protein IKL05_00025 [Clostridia bacterium]|nr:hypothetical protein [Clostridia bacterium]